MALIRWRGRLKGYFFALRLHYLIPSGLLEFLANLAKLSRWIHQNKSVDFHDFYSPGFRYNKREDLFRHVIQGEGLDGPIDYLEFGVSTGASFRWWIGENKHPQSRFFGFDTFTGLPEDWGPFKKGDMSNNDSLPEVDDPRHTFFQGLFQQTLPGFLNAFQPENRKVIHMDADLYSSTLYVLTQLTPFLKPGDVIFFDEFNVPMHEFKAFDEWTRSFYLKYEVLGGVNNFYGLAVKLV